MLISEIKRSLSHKQRITRQICCPYSSCLLFSINFKLLCRKEQVDWYSSTSNSSDLNVRFFRNCSYRCQISLSKYRERNDRHCFHMSFLHFFFFFYTEMNLRFCTSHVLNAHARLCTCVLWAHSADGVTGKHLLVITCNRCVLYMQSFKWCNQYIGNTEVLIYTHVVADCCWPSVVVTLAST